MIFYIDRRTKEIKEEKVYGAAVLDFLYGESLLSRLFGRACLPLLSKYPFFSWLYGFLQNLPLSKKKILPFIENYQIDSSEFLIPPASFLSFNDFFTRRLKPEARPIDIREKVAVIPADGRYLFYSNAEEVDGFVVKGEKFSLATLLEDEQLARRYEKGSLVIARLCPTDYHRFHFPCRCLPSPTTLINGWLLSVNPIAIKRDVHIFTQNKRSLTQLSTEQFGTIIFMEIGATNVGSIHQTYKEGVWQDKGAEKGFFGFGASSLVLLFEPGRIRFDEDLLTASKDHKEILCLMGQSMGCVSVEG